MTNPGINWSIPESWQILHTTDAFNEEKWNKLSLDKKRELIRALNGKSILEVYRYGNDHEGVNPGLKISVRKANALQGMKIEKLLMYMVGQFQNMLGEFNLVSRPENVELSGIESARTIFDHTVKPEKSNIEILIRTVMYMIPRDDHYFIVSIHSEKKDTDSIEQLKGVVESLVILH